MSLQRQLALTIAALLGVAVPANAATVTLSLDRSASPIPKRSALSLGGGAVAWQAPLTGLRFTATVTNDAGGPALPPPETFTYGTVDLVGRTVDGETVLDTQEVIDTNPVEFTVAFVDQNTTYFARLNPAPQVGVAAATASNTVVASAYLRNVVAALRRPSSRKVAFSGVFAKPDTVKPSTAVRVLVQRRSGKNWRTLETIAPNVRREWEAIVPVGAEPAVFRVRTVPFGAVKRYVPVTELSYCVAAAPAAAKKACRSVVLGAGPRAK